MNRFWLGSYRLIARLSRRGLEEFVNRNLQGVEGVVLNLGCGNRRVLCPAGAREVRLDISRHRSLDLQADACNMPFAEQVFNAIVSTEVLEHLCQPEAAVREMSRVLKAGGIVVLTTRFMFQIHDAPDDFFRFTKFGLEFLFREFQDVRVHPQHSGYMSFLVMVGRLQMEKAPIIRWLSLPLALAVVALSTLEPIANRMFPIETVTTGYFIFARK